MHKRYAALQNKFENVMVEKDGLEMKLEKVWLCRLYTDNNVFLK